MTRDRQKRAALHQITVSTELCISTDDCVHTAMYYKRWLCPLRYVLQEMTVSTGLRATMDDWALAYHKEVSLALHYMRYVWCLLGLESGQSMMTVSTGLCTARDDCVHWAMGYNGWLCTGLSQRGKPGLALCCMFRAVWVWNLDRASRQEDKWERSIHILTKRKYVA